MSVGRILTLGLGAFGGVEYLPTLGFTAGAAVVTQPTGETWHWQPPRPSPGPPRVFALAGVARIAVWVRSAGDFIPARRWALAAVARLGGLVGTGNLRRVNHLATRERIERKRRLLGL